MKKITKKLSIKKQIISNLNENQLDAVAGGQVNTGYDCMGSMSFCCFSDLPPCQNATLNDICRSMFCPAIRFKGSF